MQGKRDDILKIKDTAGIDIKADVTLAPPDGDNDKVRLVEAILLPHSRLIGRTLWGSRLRERFGLQVLAINRQAATLRRQISQIPLRMGDVLLIQGSEENIKALDASRAVSLLAAVDDRRLNVQRAPIASAIFVLAIAAAASNLLSPAMAMVAGTVAVFLTGCLTPEEAYRDVEWKALILIGSLLALGAAMDRTGTAEFLAAQVVRLLGQAESIWLLSAFFGLTLLLTQPMSNQTAAAVIVPVAIQTAVQLGLEPRTFSARFASALEELLPGAVEAQLRRDAAHGLDHKRDVLRQVHAEFPHPLLDIRPVHARREGLVFPLALHRLGR